MDPQLEIEPGKTLHPSYALTRSQSLGGVRSTSAGNYPVIPVFKKASVYYIFVIFSAPIRSQILPNIAVN